MFVCQPLGITHRPPALQPPVRIPVSLWNPFVHFVPVCLPQYVHGISVLANSIGFSRPSSMLFGRPQIMSPIHCQALLHTSALFVVRTFLDVFTVPPRQACTFCIRCCVVHVVSLSLATCPCHLLCALSCDPTRLGPSSESDCHHAIGPPSGHVR